MKSTDASTTTTNPVQWLPIPEAVRLFGISRSYLYELIGSSKIKSVCLRKAENVKGRRLISAESLNAFIESYLEQPSQAAFNGN